MIDKTLWNEYKAFLQIEKSLSKNSIMAYLSDVERFLIYLHDEFKEIDFEKYYKEGAVVFDAKAVVDRRWVDGRL